MAVMEFGVLGPLEVVQDGQPVELRRAKVRAVLAMLVLNANEVVSAERLIEALWGDAPPASAANTLQTYISLLRNTLGGSLIQTRAPGYVLTIDPEQVDAFRFERLAFEGRTALQESDPERAAKTFATALSLWRGPTLAEFAYEEFARNAITRLQELRLRVIEDRVDAELALGRHQDVLGELKGLVAAEPLRERRWGQLMLALYRAGRQADALRAYQDLRRTLGDELGIDPSLELRQLEAAMLNQDPSLHPPVPKPAPSEAGAVCEPLLAPFPARLRTVSDFPFVARQAQLAFLRAQEERAAAGHQRLVLIAGEPGVGKTRLAAEAAAAANERGAAVLFGRCDGELAIPYQPFAEALGELIRRCPPGQLLPLLGPFPGELVRLLPQLASAIHDLPPPVTSDPEMVRYRLFDAVGHWLGALSKDVLLVLLLDDLHWAARPTLLLLRHVLLWPEPLSLLVLGTYRESDISDRHPLADLVGDLRREHRVERLTLDGLDDEGVRAFIEEATGQCLDERGLDRSGAISADTGGNPFFLGEVIRHLRDSGGLIDAEGRWLLDSEAVEGDVPEGIRDVVRSRVAKLSGDAGRMLTVAAVMGAEFEVAPLTLASGLDEFDLFAALDEAVEAALIVELPSSPARYRFAHALVRASLYEQLSASRRVHLHRRVGEAIESVHASRLDEHLPSLAHHFRQAATGGHDRAKASAYLMRAGQAAMAQLANDQASTFFQQALELEDKTDDRCDVLIALGEAQKRGGAPEHRETLLRAAELAKKLGDPERLARAALTSARAFWSVTYGIDVELEAVLGAALEALDERDSAVRARVLAHLAMERVYSGTYAENRQLSDEALAMARRLGDLETLLWVLCFRAAVLRCDPGALRERLDNTAEFLEVATKLGDLGMEALAWGYRTLAFMETTDIPEANRCWARFNQLGIELRQPTLRWYYTYCEASRLAFFGRLDEAEELAVAALQLGGSLGHPDAELFFRAQAFQFAFERGMLANIESLVVAALDEAAVPARGVRRSMLALLYRETERPEKARELFELLGDGDFRKLPKIPSWLYTLANCAEVCAYLGDERRARMLYDLMEPYADQLVTLASLGYSGSVAHYLARLAETMGDDERAEELFATAAAVHERVGAPGWLARTRFQWAELLIRRGDPGRQGEAREMLQQALDAARDLRAGTVEARARRLLDGWPRACRPRADR